MMGSGVRVPSAAPVTYWNTSTKWPSFGAAFCCAEAMEPWRNQIQNRVHGDFNNGKVILIIAALQTEATESGSLRDRHQDESQLPLLWWPRSRGPHRAHQSDFTTPGASSCRQPSRLLMPWQVFHAGNEGNTGNRPLIGPSENLQLAHILRDGPHAGPHEAPKVQDHPPPVGRFAAGGWILDRTQSVRTDDPASTSGESSAGRSYPASA